MTLAVARILRGGQPVESKQPAAPPDDSARVVRRERAEALLGAQKLLQQAEAQAASILERARRQAQEQQQQAEQRAREQARAELALSWAALRAREAQADQHALDRILEVARMLAERLVHQQLRLAPETIVPMAREAVAQFWHANAITLRACPEDLQVLDAHAQQLGVAASVLRLEADPNLSRGSVRLLTPEGGLQADVAVQLDRLLEALRK